MQYPIWRAKPGEPDEAETAEDVAAYIRQQWQTDKADPGLREALLQIYARSAELLIERINQLPENYYRAFLNEAGVDLLPPKPARAEVTFHLPPTDDSPAYVLVPAGTQVATQPSAGKAEVIFETTEELVVMPNRLVKCVTFDERTYRDVTALSTTPSNKRPFNLFSGTQKRERMLLVGDEQFTYPTAAAAEQPDDVVRAQTHFDLCVEVDMMPLFCCLEPTAEKWKPGPIPPSIHQQFKRRGHPLTADARATELYRGDEMIDNQTRAIAGWSIIDGGVYYSVRQTDQTLSVYRRTTFSPTRKLTWFYWNAEQETPGWVPLLQEEPDKEESADAPTITDSTYAFQNDGVIRFTKLPTLTKSKIEGVESYWLACQLTGDQPPAALPTITRIRLARTLAFAPTQTIPIEAALAGTQGGTIFTPPLPSTTEVPAMLPFGPLPQRLDAFYLRADHAFRPAGAVVQLTFQLESIPDHLRDLIGSRYERKLAATLPQIAWEYYTKAGWQTIKEVKPKLTWSDLPDKGWSITDITHDPSDQEQDDDPPYQSVDPTHGFLKLGEHTIRLTLGEAKPALLTINEQTGYWLRARLVVGAYGLPGEMQRFLRWATEWTPPITFAPLIQGLTLRARLPQEAVFYPLEYCFSRVDQCWGTTIEQAKGKSWRTKPILAKDWQKGAVTAWCPLSARDEGPALYLGFQPALPTGQWLRLLFDVVEQESTTTTTTIASALQWQFWHGVQQEWQPLQPVSDETKGLTRRGYLGFYGPADHGISTEFGQEAYWLRAIFLPDPRPQAGVLGHRLLKEWQQVEAVGRTATLSFDKPTRPLTYQAAVPNDEAARVTAGANQTLLLWQRAAAGQAAPVKIDASPSKAANGATHYLVRYHLRRVRPKSRRTTASPVHQLGGIRLNTVAVINKQTIKAEVIGQSNGQPNQHFTLVRKPVLDQISNGNRFERFAQEPKTLPDELVLEVAEFDPPTNPLTTTRRLTTSVPTAQAQGAGEAQWHEWQRINHFAEAGPTSRVYQLDAIQGLVIFGDGKQGLIPLAGSQIRALTYCTHAGSDGNVGAGQITVLRNPAGDLAKIEGVINHEAASGGRAPESVESVMKRGPRAIKNQGRAVSAEDLAWLARHSGADLVNAYPVTVRDQRGRPLAGQAELVILPRQLEAATPTATAMQQRTVKAYLAQYLQANLQAADALTIRNPTYVMVDVTVWLVPKKPAEAEQLQRDATDLLQQFLHPVQGGPHWRTQREQGWPFGRELFVSQLYAQLESLPTVDYVNRITVHSSMLQYQLQVGAPLPQWSQAAALPPATMIPAGAQISTLDEGKKLILSEPLSLAELLREGEAGRELSVHGFNRGDELLVRCEGEATAVPVHLSELRADGTDDAGCSSGRYKISLQVDRTATATDAMLLAWRKAQPTLHLWIESRDGRVRLPLTLSADDTIAQMPDKDHLSFTYDGQVVGLLPGEFISIFMGHRRLDLLWPIQCIATVQDRVYIPDGYLIASGQHQINLTLTKVRL